jgi:prepilin signal peptidase PulO-like enzyme (type II secretory pathway)
MSVSVPVYVWLGAALVFGCSAFLAMRLAAFVYGDDAPLEGGPAPTNVPAAAMIAGSAIVGAIAALHGTTLAGLAIVEIVVFALCAAIWTDVTRGFIGDWFTLPPLALVVAIAAFNHTFGPMLLSLAVVTVPFAIAALASKGIGMGWGDVKLVALGAALLDIQTSILMYAVACMVACAIAFARRKRTEPIAFAPYLASAIAIGMILPTAHIAS